jgi:hypothetical protein
MSRLLWCWRCQIDVPMLDETEWLEVVTPWAEAGPIESAGTVAGGADGLMHRRQAFLESYNRLTGFAETNPEAVMHHRIADYGPPCVACGRPLRTSLASFCASCGRSVIHAG